MHRQREELVVTGGDPRYGRACSRPHHGNQPRGEAWEWPYVDGPLPSFLVMAHNEFAYGMIQSFNGSHTEQHPAQKELLDGHHCRCAQQV
jgi:hypothetical protein